MSLVVLLLALVGLPLLVFVSVLVLTCANIAQKTGSHLMALCAVLVLASVSQACPPSFNLNSYSVQQSSACYAQPVRQFQAYVAPVQVQSYAVQSYVQPVQQFQSYQSYVQPVRQKVFVQRKAFAVQQQNYGVQQFAVQPQVIQQSTVERKGLFGLRKNKTTTTTIINP